MKVIATNIARPVTFLLNGKEVQTGIFKYPIAGPLYLKREFVAQDTIANKKVHGGIHKACYLFSADQYPYWKKKYPDLEWDWGMFGENITLKGLDEAVIRIGNIYKLGTAKVQISQPREPCYKLGVRFGNQKIIQQFIEHGYPGTYVRVLEEGKVSSGDTMELVQQSVNPLTVRQFYTLLYSKKKNQDVLLRAMENEALPEGKRKTLERYLK